MDDSADGKLDINFNELVALGLLRSAAGFGLGLLLAERFAAKNRRRIGWTLFFGSIAAGLPIGVKFLKKNKEIF